MARPRVTIDHYAIRIHFGRLLHLYVKRSEFLAVQSWSDDDHNFSIEFVLTGGSIVTEYDNAATWRAILSALDCIL